MSSFPIPLQLLITLGSLLVSSSASPSQTSSSKITSIDIRSAHPTKDSMDSVTISGHSYQQPQLSPSTPYSSEQSYTSLRKRKS
jgi:hypothetical protein